MSIELAHMRNFVAVAESGQMSRAAQRLHLSQPSLSQSIKQLELRLGVPLLARHPRGVRLTPEDVADEPVPATPPGTEQRLVDALHLAHLRARPPREADVAPRTLDEAAALIGSGGAVCLGPESLARAFLRPGLVIRPLVG